MAGRQTMLLEEGPRLDLHALGLERRARALAAMEAAEVDVLMVIRPGNVRYVGGHRPLWRAVLTPWAPMATLTRSGAAYLMSTWDDGIPPEVPHENLIGLTWNPGTIVSAISAIEGLAGATRIAVDGMTGGLAMLLGHLAPGVELVDADALLRPLRAVKSPVEVECIRTAIAVTEGALFALRDDVRPGVSEVALRARFQEELGRYGVNHPAVEGIVATTPRDGSALRRIPSGNRLAAGDLVAVGGAAQFAGYEGAVARTWACTDPGGAPTPAQRALHDRWRSALDALLGACRVGCTGRDVRRAWASTGEAAVAGLPLVHGLGLGAERPVVDPAVAVSTAEDEPFPEGAVLVVQAYVSEPGVGGYLGSEVVHVTASGPEVLTNLRHEL